MTCASSSPSQAKPQSLKGPGLAVPARARRLGGCPSPSQLPSHGDSRLAAWPARATHWHSDWRQAVNRGGAARHQQAGEPRRASPGNPGLPQLEGSSAWRITLTKTGEIDRCSGLPVPQCGGPGGPVVTVAGLRRGPPLVEPERSESAGLAAPPGSPGPRQLLNGGTVATR